MGTYIGSTSVKKLLNLLKSNCKITPYKYYTINLNADVFGSGKTTTFVIINDVLYFNFLMHKTCSINVNGSVLFGTIQNFSDMKTRYGLSYLTFEIPGCVVTNTLTQQVSYVIKMKTTEDTLYLYAQGKPNETALVDTSDTYIVFNFALPLTYCR